jgi:hypothetical protein
MSANTEDPTRRCVYSGGGGEYVVNSDRFELPRGAHFVALPIQVKDGDLALIAIYDHLLVGRWRPARAESNRIAMPGLLIVCDVPVRIIGKVVMVPPLKVCQAGRIKATPGSRN